MMMMMLVEMDGFEANEVRGSAAVAGVAPDFIAALGIMSVVLVEADSCITATMAVKQIRRGRGRILLLAGGFFYHATHKVFDRALF
jgi:hypothetical protein